MTSEMEFQASACSAELPELTAEQRSAFDGLYALTQKGEAGAALLQGRELVSARDCLARSLLLEPGRPDALLLSARLDLAAGQTNLAERTLADLLEKHPRLKAAADLRAEIRGGGAK